MLKKTVALFAALVLLLTSSACADIIEMDGCFSIRNGITFRMPAKSIIAAEKAYGTRVDVINATVPVAANNSKGYTNIDVVRYNRMPLLGTDHDYCSLAYFLDQNGQCNGLFYSINTDGSLTYLGSVAKKDYNRIQKDLIAKYGTPTGQIKDGVGTLTAVHTQAFNQVTFYTYERYPIRTCSQWIIKYDDCYCIVELFIREHNDPAMQRIGNVSHVVLGYRLITPEEFNALTKDATQQNNKRYQDI